MEKQENRSNPTNRESGPTQTFDIQQVRTYTIRPSGYVDGDHKGWIAEIKFHNMEQQPHKIYGQSPKDVLERLMTVIS